MWAELKDQTQWTENLYVAVIFPWQMQSEYYMEVTRTTCILHISARILNPFHKSRSFRIWVKGVNVHPEDVTSHTTQYHDLLWKDVDNKYFEKYTHLRFIEPESVPSINLFPSAMVSTSWQSWLHPYHWSCDGKEYSIREDVLQTMPRWSNRTTCLSTAIRLHLNSLSEIPPIWGQVNLNLNDYHSSHIKISSTLKLLHLTHWWHHHESMHSKNTNFPNVVCDIFSIIAHGVSVEARLTSQQDLISQMQPNTRHKMLFKTVVVKKFASANNGILTGNNPRWSMRET